METATNSEQPGATADGKPARSGDWWRLPLLLAVVLAAIVAARASQMKTRTGGADAETPLAAVDPKAAPVSLVIRSSDGKEREFKNIGYRPGMTIDDLMSEAGRGGEAFNYRVAGDGQMSMLHAIDKDFNEWEGGRNWTYTVNDQMGDRSFAVYELKPGDRVLWTFGKRQ
jgi:hypothetical protein